MARTAIVNIGCIVTGDLTRPVAEGDALLIEDGKIVGVGRAGDLDVERADTVID
ncbi:MAG: Enamidase, partial [Deltaproteobacteria bacterium]|nr:Enamidase [Deltaproteobacteria bacterium]